MPRSPTQQRCSHRSGGRQRLASISLPLLVLGLASCGRGCGAVDVEHVAEEEFESRLGSYCTAPRGCFMNNCSTQNRAKADGGRQVVHVCGIATGTLAPPVGSAGVVVDASTRRVVSVGHAFFMDKYRQNKAIIDAAAEGFVSFYVPSASTSPSARDPAQRRTYCDLLLAALITDFDLCAKGALPADHGINVVCGDHHIVGTCDVAKRMFLAEVEPASRGGHGREEFPPLQGSASPAPASP